MTLQRSISRRSVLAGTGATLSTVLLAGCSGGGGGDGDDGGDGSEDSDGGSGNGGAGDGGSDGGSGTAEYLEDGPDYGGWFDDTSNFEGTVDWTGQDTVTVDVGAGSSGLLFGPPAIAVDSGTTVTWEWTGAGGTHNVVAEDGSFDSGSQEAGSDVTFEHTFEETGTYQYVCDPHETVGMKGAVHVV